jgi:hypothetical protein
MTLLARESGGCKTAANQVSSNTARGLLRHSMHKFISTLELYHAEHLKVGCLHPVACTRSGSGFPSNVTLV